MPESRIYSPHLFLGQKFWDIIACNMKMRDEVALSAIGIRSAMPKMIVA
jgi:hypothetical protein